MMEKVILSIEDANRQLRSSRMSDLSSSMQNGKSFDFLCIHSLSEVLQDERGIGENCVKNQGLGSC